MKFELDSYLISRPEKFREAAREIFQFIQARAGSLQPEISGDLIGWGRDQNDWFLLSLSVRKGGVMLYCAARVLDPYDDILRSRRTGMTCVKLSRLGTLDEQVLDDIVTKAFNPPADGKEHAGKAYAERAASKKQLTDFDAYLADKPEKTHDLARKLYTLIRSKIGEEPYAYDDHILGFGRRDDGWYKVLMAARASGVMLYTSGRILDRHADLIKKSWRTGKSCLKLTRWDQLPESVIEDIVDQSLAS
ncbi:hypothetical protein KQI52_09465 [bacterium]|nr:hypothetical protein [bacterium]